MSNRLLCCNNRLPLLAALAALLMLALSAAGSSGLPPSQTDQTSARLECFTQPDGSSDFALLIKPGVAVPAAARHDVVLLFDTSASQAGQFRSKALAALEALLAGMPAHDRVKLLAADLQAVPLSDGFVAPRGAEMAAALQKLKMRVPLGTTDMEQALATAAAGFPAAGSAAGGNSARSMVYIGKGTSTANLLDAAQWEQLSKALVEGRISVSSYAIGPNLDRQLLGAAAARTGGIVLVEDPQIAGGQAGEQLANAIGGTVLWPTAVRFPAAFVEVFPQQVPPLRSDRESVIIGTMKGEGTLEMQMSVESPGGSQQLAWTIPPGRSDPRNGYLAQLVGRARLDGGLSLPLVDARSLAAVRDEIKLGVFNGVELARQALNTGALEQAQQLLRAALRANPSDKDALALQAALEKRRATPTAATDEPAAAAPAAAAPAPAAPAPAAEGAGGGDLNLVGAPPAAPPAGAFAESVRHQQHLVQTMVQTDVLNAVNQARRQMATDPEGATQNLKLLWERVRQAPELTAEVRGQLTDTIEVALRESARRMVEEEQRRQLRNESRAAAAERALVLDGLERKEQKMKQLIERFESLMDEGRYRDAEEKVAVAAEKLDPSNPVPVLATLEARQVGYHQESMEVRVARQKGVVDTLASVERSHVPFPDEPPIVYPAAEVWKELTQRRKDRYSSVDLAKPGPQERKIAEELKKPTQLEFVETPLQDVIDYLKQYHGIEIQLDKKALEQATVGTDTPITKNLKGISLRSALRLMLKELDLTYVIQDEVLLITTQENADSRLITKVYPVADLVLPVGNMMSAVGGGGMGGGGMMGGMGGMGGMMGGGGGGMGGGGGGGGGMGGGMFNVPPGVLPRNRNINIPAGGFQAFAVNDDLAVSAHAAKADAGRQTAEGSGQLAPGEYTGGGGRKVEGGKSNSLTPLEDGKGVRAAAESREAIPLTVPPGSTAEACWEQYFAAHEPAPAAVRDAVRRLMDGRQCEQVVAAVEAALRHGQSQPWMYEALVLALQAGEHPQEELERAVMSAADFAQNSLDLLYLGVYLTRLGLDHRAIELFRQVAKREPVQPEPYAYALQAAERLGDLPAVQWAAVGVFSQAWPRAQAEVWKSAEYAAKAALERLKKEKRTAEAQQFEAAVNEALRRDCVVLVSWTGEADVDLWVEEPGGAVCSLRNPRTSGGGLLLSDNSAAKLGGTDEAHREAYVCPQGFDGAYRILLRRVWGKPTAGKVTVEVYTHYGSQDSCGEKKKIALVEDEARLVFDLRGGRRKEALEEQQVANAAAGQLAVRRQILSQQLADAVDPQAMENFFISRQTVTNGGVTGGGTTGVANPFGPGLFPFQGAVGYQPVIQVLPEGAMLMATAVISADRRYVRISPSPMFMGIAKVSTFNYVTGQQSNNVGGGTGGQGFSGTTGSSGGGTSGGVGTGVM